jgi:hypothetical protein
VDVVLHIVIIVQIAPGPTPINASTDPLMDPQMPQQTPDKSLTYSLTNLNNPQPTQMIFFFKLQIKKLNEQIFSLTHHKYYN